MNHTIHVQARAIIIQQSHILLCKTVGLDHNFYFLPGGHVEHYESATQAIKRELLEEVGFTFEIHRFLGCLEYAFDPKEKMHAKCHTHEYNFIFEASSHDLAPPHLPLQQIEPHIEIAWIAQDQLNQIDLRPGPLVELIPQWLKNQFNDAYHSQMISLEKNLP